MSDNKKEYASASFLKQSGNDIDSIESLYMALGNRVEIKAKAFLMLIVRDWLTEVSTFDPTSGHALQTGIVDFMDVVGKSMQDESFKGDIKDRIFRIVSHTKEAVLTILEHTRDKILREHAMMPLYAAREVDSNCVQWLSRQPGRNIREKLSGKPYMKAVRRRTSVDTSENRLLKAFILRLEQILIEKQTALAGTADGNCEELLVSFQRWLRSEDASEIGAWENLPPNNSLLQDRQYRKVWDGWIWLQGIDESIRGDCKRINSDVLSVICWKTLSLLNHTGRFRTIQQPIGLNYDNFAVVPAMPIRGYLFPACGSRLKGEIKDMNYDKGFGFLTSETGNVLFFHTNNLSRKSDFKFLKPGDTVTFVIGRNNQGVCADDVTALRLLHFSISGDKFEIEAGTEKFTLQFESGQLTIQQLNGKTNKLDHKSAAISEVPKTLFSLITGSPFEYSVPETNPDGLLPMDRAVVDLCSIRPRFSDKAGKQAMLPFRLLQQTWKLKDGSNHILDCGKTRAFALRSDIETVSMRSLFLHNSTLSYATKSSASSFFVKRLHEYIQTSNLIYLVPDWGNEFDLESVRKSVNFYFEKSTPLPKSIAAIFAWQSSNDFVKTPIKDEGEVLILDAFFGGFSITPVRAVYNKVLHKRLPESKGITWERHPTILVKNSNFNKKYSEYLSKIGFPDSENVIALFGLEGLRDEAGNLSIENSGNWFNIPPDLSFIMNSNQNDYDSNDLEFVKYLSSLDSTNLKSFVIPTSNTIYVDRRFGKHNVISVDLDMIQGGITIQEWQEVAGDIPLWRDHLPKLSIRIVRAGQYENFYLVKDAKVTPKRGEKVTIPVEESFTLPAGKPHYSFPLQQGEGNKELRFVAYLKSPAFPLKEDSGCRLKMTYTYGADDPYELEFVPLDSAKAGFKSIHVEWRSATEDVPVDLSGLPFPEFPSRKNWDDFRKFPGRDGNNQMDLTERVTKYMQKITSYANFIKGKGPSNRIYHDDMDVFQDWKVDINGKHFCFVKIEDCTVFFHEVNFEKFDAKAKEISFDLEEQKGRVEYLAECVTLGRTFPREFFRKKLRFPVLTIWNHGHSLAEPDMPDNFRKGMEKGIKHALTMIEAENVDESFKDELFFFLCCLHKDAPAIVGARLLEAIRDKELLLKYRKNIAYVIGDCKLLWQQKLLESVLSPVHQKFHISMEILSIALWRSKELIFKLKESDLEIVCAELESNFKISLEQISTDVPNENIEIQTNKGLTVAQAKEKERGKQAHYLCRYLELLLALLRSRENESKSYKMILAPGVDLTNRFVDLVDRISEVVINRHIELKPWIDLKIEKPEMFNKTPDLLYALRMYLTGDSGANTIVINSVKVED